MSIAVELEKLKNLRASGAITPEEFEESKNRLLDSCVRRIEAAYDPKTPTWPRWGLPPAKVARGVVQVIRFSPGKDNLPYAAFLNVDGQKVEISSASPICIDAGDRVMLGGYEREGRLMALAYTNESTGNCSDLSRLRKGYRLLLAIGTASALAGLAAIVVMVILPLLHKPLISFHLHSWRFVPYVLSGLGGAAVSYLGLGLSFLGARAKEFHDAMTSSGLRIFQP
jgi:putative oligomerization/nucleic acid binding protein